MCVSNVMAPTLLFQQPIGYWWLPMLKTSTYVDVLKFRRFLSITLLRFFFYFSLSVLRTDDACICATIRLADGTNIHGNGSVNVCYVKHVLLPMAIRKCVCVCHGKVWNCCLLAARKTCFVNILMSYFIELMHHMTHYRSKMHNENCK